MSHIVLAKAWNNGKFLPNGGGYGVWLTNYFKDEYESWGKRAQKQIVRILRHLYLRWKTMVKGEGWRSGSISTGIRREIWLREPLCSQMWEDITSFWSRAGNWL